MINAARVGEQSDVEWNCVYRSPFFATRSKAGVGIAPPNVLGEPNPQSSVMIKRTFGDPLAKVIIGGQGLSLLLTLLVTPVAYTLGGFYGDLAADQKQVWAKTP